MLTQRGIEANPEKCKAMIEMRSPTNVKEVQRLVGHLTAISRFLPKLADQTRPIIQLLKKSVKFSWSEDCECIFQNLKTTLTSPLILRKPDINLPLLVYITTTNNIVSAALIQESAGVQYLMYFVSRFLQDKGNQISDCGKTSLVFGKCSKKAPSLILEPPKYRQNKLPHSKDRPKT